MAGFWLVSYIALWLLAIILLFAIVFLVRQVGLLHVRVEPAGARYTPVGPGVGTAIPPREYYDLDGLRRVVGGPTKRPTLLAFVSPTCSVCDGLAGALSGLARTEPNLSVVALSARGDEVANRRAAERWWGSRIPLIVSPALETDFQVRTSPYAIILDTEGVIRGQGIVNQIEHLHSLLNALETGYATLDVRIQATRDQNGHVVPAPAGRAAIDRTEGL